MATTRADRSKANLDRVIARLRTDEFEVVHPGRWRQRKTGVEVETGYTFSESVVRLYANGDRNETDRVTFRGSDGEIDQLDRVLPAA